MLEQPYIDIGLHVPVCLLGSQAHLVCAGARIRGTGENVYF